MLLTVVNRKGGSSKTTTALHLAAALADPDPAVALVDLDEDNQSAAEYAAAGHLPFTTTTASDWDAGLNRQRWAHIIADAYARPTAAQLLDLSQRSDLLLIPTPPDALSLRVLARMLPDLQTLRTPYAVLLTMAPPRPSREPERALRDLQAGGVPVLRTVVPRAAAFARAARARRLAWDMPGGRRLRFIFDDLAEEVLHHAP